MYGNEIGTGENVERRVDWGVRLAVEASLNLAQTLPDELVDALSKLDIDVPGESSTEAGIRILSQDDGSVRFVFEFNGGIEEFEFECLDDEDCAEEEKRTGKGQYCNTPTRAGTDWAPDELMTCRSLKDSGEFCTADASCESNECQLFNDCSILSPVDCVTNLAQCA